MTKNNAICMHALLASAEQQRICRRCCVHVAVACQASTDDCSKLGHACVHQQQQAGRSLGYCFFFGKFGFFLLFPLDDPCCVVCRPLAVKNSSAIKCPKIHLTPPDVHTQTAVLAVLFLYLDAGFRRSRTKSVRTGLKIRALKI
ncbi:Endothelin-1 [Trichinella spiralis]|uniref:Endothelin-1 n=1 Tax=Trichinella spiralis TaxID=6334 RepID=A0ABR3KJJ0_TRISP